VDDFNGASQSHMASYVGISGAVDLDSPAVPPAAFVEQRQRVCCTCCGGSSATGRVSGGGMLLLNQCTNMSDCTDGTSNVMILGETSDWAIDPATGAKMHIDPSWPHGWAMGAGGYTTIAAYNPPPNPTSYDGRTFNLTAIRYPIGTRIYGLPGVWDNHGVNNPLVAAHPGGCQILLTDGSSRFASETMNLLTLKYLATRDDGQVLPNF
jgi:hypothetical protein